MVEIIDFRARPNVEEYARYLRPRLEEIHRQTAGHFGAYRAPTESVGDFVTQLEGAGISKAVFAARSRVESSSTWKLTNEIVLEAVRAYPDHLVPFGGVDLEGNDPEKQVLDAVEEFGFAGVCIDPFQIKGDAADSRLDPVYAASQELGTPVIVTMGGMPGVPAPLACGNPMALDTVAGRFPELVLVGSHSGWPFVTEMIAVAWRRENVYFENSFYHDAPGAQMLVEAANTMIGHKMIYASAYPFAPVAETLNLFKELPFDPDVLPDVLGGNARRVLAAKG